MKLHEEIRILTTGKGENYTLDVYQIMIMSKINYRLRAVDLSRRKEFDARYRCL